MVGVAIGFASTTAFPAVETLSENGKGRTMSLCGDAICQAGANKAVRPYRIRNAKASPPKGDRGKERKSYAIDRPLFIIFFEVGQIENEMHKVM